MQPDPRTRWIATAVLVLVGLALVALPRFIRSRGPATTNGLWQVTLRAAGIAPTDSTPPDSSRIARALASVPDPELDLSIVELGLVESIAPGDSGRARIVLGLTTPVCPYGADIARAALEAVRRVPGVRSVEVRINPEAVWNPARVSEEVRRRLGLFPRP